MGVQSPFRTGDTFSIFYKIPGTRTKDLQKIGKNETYENVESSKYIYIYTYIKKIATSSKKFIRHVRKCPFFFVVFFCDRSFYFAPFSSVSREGRKQFFPHFSCRKYASTARAACIFDWKSFQSSNCGEIALKNVSLTRKEGP